MNASRPPDRLAGNATCRNCGGEAARPAAGVNPPGWYGVTVALPWKEGRRGYAWIGLFCTAACLAAYGPQMQRREELERQTYEAAPAVMPAVNPSGYGHGGRTRP